MSANTIILTSRNQDPNQLNKFKYTLPQTTSFEQHEIGLVQCSIYNSFFNITAERDNNQFTIIWNANTIVSHNFVLVDGHYDLSQLNYAIQNFCLAEDLYMIDKDGKPVFFIEIIANAIIYGAQLSIFALPTAAEATTLQYTIPIGATWSLPVTASTPQFEFTQSAFGTIIGFTPGTFPSSILTTDQSFVSDLTPTVDFISSIFMTSNLVSSQYSNPSNILTNIPITEAFGKMLITKNSTPLYIPVVKSKYSSIEICLSGNPY